MVLELYGSKYSFLGQPTTGSPLCLAASTTSGKWSAQPCYQSRPYACKVPAIEDTCPTPTPSCNNGFNANGACICGTATCTAGQDCDQASSTCMTPPLTCKTGSPVDGTCICKKTQCVKGQTCSGDGACTPASCPATGGAPTGGCICGTNGNTCNKDETCTAVTGTCASAAADMPPGA